MHKAVVIVFGHGHGSSLPRIERGDNTGSVQILYADLWQVKVV